MKKIFAVLLLISIVALKSHTQTIKVYYERPGDQGAFDIISCTDSGYLILSSGLVSKVDQNGVVIWDKQLNFSGLKATETDGGYYIVGSIDSSYFDFGYLVKINKQGEFLWSKKYKNQEIASLKHIKRISNNELILSMGHYWLGSGFPNYTILKTDSLGNIIWSRGASQDATSSISMMENGNFVIIGSSFHENQPPQYPETCWPFKEEYSNNGSTLSFVYLDNMDWAACTASISDGESFYFTTSNSNYSVYKMGDSLISWTKYFGNFGYYSICTDTNNLYFTGSFGDLNYANLFVLSITNEGDSISTYIDDEDSNHHGVKIIIDDDSLVIISITKKFNNSDWDVCFTKMPIQYVLTNTEEVDPDHKSDFSIYPNPTSKVAYFKSNHSQHKKSIKIFSLSGDLKMVKQSSENYIDVTSLKQGIYLIEIKCCSETMIEKFIKR